MDGNDEATADTNANALRHGPDDDAGLFAQSRQRSKIREIMAVCKETRDGSALATLATSPGGFVDDETRCWTCTSNQTSSAGQFANGVLRRAAATGF